MIIKSIQLTVCSYLDKQFCSVLYRLKLKNTKTNFNFSAKVNNYFYSDNNLNLKKMHMF